MRVREDEMCPTLTGGCLTQSGAAASPRAVTDVTEACDLGQQYVARRRYLLGCRQKFTGPRIRKDRGRLLTYGLELAPTPACK